MVVLSPPGSTSPSKLLKPRERATKHERPTHLRHPRPAALQRRAVFPKRALERQHADVKFAYHPRSCMRCSGAMVEISRPGMASPSPSDTSASTAGSL